MNSFFIEAKAVANVTIIEEGAQIAECTAYNFARPELSVNLTVYKK